MNLQWKTSAISTLLIFTLAAPTTIFANHHTIESTKTLIASTQFTDVKADHYAYEAIQWAKSKGIVNGYGDGRFGPNDAVTEAQFVKMITNYLGLKDDYGNINKTTKGAHWSDSSYDAIAKYGVPLNGYFDNTIRNKPMKRGLVAQVITHLVGYKTDLQGSIEFLLDNNITAGQNPQFKDKDLYQFFGTGNTLSRSQVVAFLHRLETEKLNTLSETIEKPNGKSLNEIATTGKKRVDSSISQGKTPSNNNGGISVTPNNPVQTPGDSGGSLEGVQLGVTITNPSDSSIKLITDFESKLSSNTINKLEKDGFKFNRSNNTSVRLHNDDNVNFDLNPKTGTLYYVDNSGVNASHINLYLTLVSDYFDVNISFKEFEKARLAYNKKDLLIKNNIYYTQSTAGSSGLYKK